MKAIYFDGDNGEVVRVEEIPADLLDLCKKKKLELIGALADNDEAMEEFFLEENIDIPAD